MSPPLAGSGSLVQCRRSARALPSARVSDRSSSTPLSAGVFPFALLGNPTDYTASIDRGWSDYGFGLRQSTGFGALAIVVTDLILPNRAREQAVFQGFPAPLFFLSAAASGFARRWHQPLHAQIDHHLAVHLVYMDHA